MKTGFFGFQGVFFLSILFESLSNSGFHDLATSILTMREKFPAFADVKREDHEMQAGDGSNICLRWYSTQAKAEKGPAVKAAKSGKN